MNDREEQQPNVVIVGLGYVGLPLALAAVRKGLSVVGLDSSLPTVASLNNGRSHVDDVEDDDLAAAIDAGFLATSDSSRLGDADIAVICVPTPLASDGTPDLSAVLSATSTIAAHLRPGMTVILESTTYPGTTDGPVRSALEAGGLVAGQDFHLAFSPERIDPGNHEFGVVNTPKVVGGVTPGCTEAAVAFYSLFIDTVVATVGAREAEMAKLLENTYRHVNIALVNEMAVFCHDLGVDLWASIEAAKTKPFGFQAFYPGPGVGGHCIPIDPNYLSYAVRSLGYPFRFVELAQEVSNRMPSYVVARAQLALNEVGMAVKGARVLLLGLTYKADISDPRESPAVPIARRFLDLGALVSAHDPFLDEFVVEETHLPIVQDLEESIASFDLVVLLQTHSTYDISLIAREARLLLDTRGVASGDRVIRL